MNRVLSLLGLLGLLFSQSAQALQLRWSTGADTLGTTTAKQAVLVLQSTPGESHLPREWRLFWAAESIQVVITPLDSVFACIGDTAQVYEAVEPATPEEIASHLSTVRFCSAGPNPSTRAAWVIDLPARARGNLRVYAFDSVDPTTVVATNTVTFGVGVVESLTTNVTVSATPNPSYTERSVTLKAVVVPIPSSGFVSFKDGISTVGTAPIAANGIASLLVSGLALGEHTFVASFDTISSPPVSHHVLPLQPTVTSLNTTPNPSRHLGTVLAVANVSPSTASGLVIFTDGGDSLGTATLIGGSASISVVNFTVGTHSLVAHYSGDYAHGSSASGGLEHEVAPLITTTVSLSASPDSAVAGQVIELTASIAPTSASGSVDFLMGGSLLGSAPLTGGNAVLLAPSVCGGSYTFAVSYSGDSTHYGSRDSLLKTVGPRAVKLTVSSTDASSRYSEPVRFVATVFDSADVDCELAGTVQFFIDDVAFGGPVSLSGDTASSPSIATLAAGRHLVRATFGGNINFQGVMSAPIQQDVESPNPVLNSVRDVIGDQGGRVKLSWTASYLDLTPFNQIESYWVLRSVPASMLASRLREARTVLRSAFDPGTPAPGTLLAIADSDTSYYWEFLSAQPAFHLPRYSYTASTTTDSVAGSNPMTPFMIMARTAGGAGWWFSNPDSGYSVDNLAPTRPQLIMSETSGGAAIARWEPSLEPDFEEYRLYWGTSADFVPDSSNLVFSGTETNFTEQARALVAYYKLSALDIHGNVSPFATGVARGVLDTPTGQSLRFGLERVWPNPSRSGPVSVDFVLTRPELAALELIDITGRRVAGGDLRFLVAGRHQLDLATGTRLMPGLYLVRLTQGSEARVRRLVVLD